MAAQRPPSSSTSRRAREGTHDEVPIGRYLRLDEIGRGSFATVYQGIHSVSLTHITSSSDSGGPFQLNVSVLLN